MQMTGEYVLAAPPAAVWRALNDPDVLRQCIPGCQSLEKVSDTEFKATVGTRIGPLQATFNGNVQLTDLDPPRSYRISGSGSGGVVGGAKGGANVRLEPQPDGGTKLLYDVDAQVTGKIAQLGSRLIDSTAKMMAGQFFDKFAEVVTAPADQAVAMPAKAVPASDAVRRQWMMVIAVAVACGIAAALIFAR